MDLLSEQLRAVHLSGGVFFDAEFSAPFSVLSPTCEHIAGLLGLGCQRVVPFHVVADGRCEARVEGLDPIPLDGGDVVVFLHGGTHVMASPGARGAVPIAPLLPPPPYDRIQRIVHGGGGPVTSVICGFLHHEGAFFNPLLDSLPRVLRVHSAPEDRRLPLAQILELIGDEAAAARPGAGCLLARLSELMFIEVLRAAMEELPDRDAGWLGGLREPFVGRALQRFHDDPGRQWDLEGISREVGLSRSAFVERFTDTVGCPPMRYLTRLRMQRATELLLETELTVPAVAEQVGYGSEASFSRAFRRVVGAPPASWRRAALS